MTSTQHAIKKIVYRLLARREYPSARIEQKLIAQGFLVSDITPVLEELRQNGIVSDQRFAEAYIHYRQSLGYGPLRIRQELQAHGLSKEMIEDHLNIADNGWSFEASRVWQKRFRGKLPADLKERGTQIRFLLYRGFTQEHIKHIFVDYKTDA